MNLTNLKVWELLKTPPTWLEQRAGRWSWGCAASALVRPLVDSIMIHWNPILLWSFLHPTVGKLNIYISVADQDHEWEVLNIPGMKMYKNRTKSAAFACNLIFLWFQQSDNLASQPVLFLVTEAGTWGVVWRRQVKWCILNGDDHDDDGGSNTLMSLRWVPSDKLPQY